MAAQNRLGAMMNETNALERYLPIRLTVLAQRLTRLVAQAYSPKFGLTAPEWRTLAVLGQHGAMPMSDVIERTGMDKVRVSRAVSRMLDSGLIMRHVDGEDRRRGILAMSQKGKSLYRQIVPLALAVEAQLLAEFTPKERATLQRLFAKLERRTAALMNQGAPAADSMGQGAG
jgi:DNA-binding MarR family transcriptional regulator